MPIYKYRCERCDEVQEVMARISDPAPTTCVKCGAEGTLRKQVVRSGFQLKGGGWYADLYGSSKSSDKKGDTKTAGAKKDSTKKDGAAEPKPESKSADSGSSGGEAKSSAA